MFFPIGKIKDEMARKWRYSFVYVFFPLLTTGSNNPSDSKSLISCGFSLSYFGELTSQTLTSC